jgi:hypothetical protein
MKNSTKGGLAALIAGGLMLGAAGLVIGAGLAHADDEDQIGFVDALQRDGFVNVKVGEAVQMGESVCSMMRSGESEHQIIVALEEPPHPIASTTAIDFVVDSHVYLCDSVPDGGYGPGTSVTAWSQRGGHGGSLTGIGA